MEQFTNPPSTRRARVMSPSARSSSRAASPTGQVDAELFLAVSVRLKTAFGSLRDAQLPPARRARWQSRLLAITDAAKEDLQRAARELDRYEDDFTRETAA